MMGMRRESTEYKAGMLVDAGFSAVVEDAPEEVKDTEVAATDTSGGGNCARVREEGVIGGFRD